MTRRKPTGRRPAAPRPAAREEIPLAGLLDGVPFAIVLVDAALTVTFANAEGRRVLGLSSSAPLGQEFPPLWSTLTGMDSAKTAACLHEVLSSRRPYRGARLRLADATGSAMPVEWICAPAHLHGHGVVVTIRDLSREEDLQQDRDRLAAIAEESPSPVIEVDRHAHLLYANPAMTSWLTRFGYDADGYPAVVPHGLPALIERCLQTGDPVLQEEVCLPEARLAWTFCPVPKHGLVRGYALDMTDIHASQLALRRSAEQLAESNRRLDQALTAAQESAKAKSAFLATVSHELRTPMNGVIGMTSLLMETSLSPEQRTYAETIKQCGEVLLQLINDVLECSKIEAGKLELERLDFDLRTTVEHVLAQFAERAETKGLELTGLVHAAVPTALRGDPGRLRQVLTNLVGNAVKFTERGDVTLQAYLEEDGADAAVIRFEVTDSGIGIPLETQAKLFMPFVQADSSTTRKYGGTGLGLSISKQLVELMGGRMGVTSLPGKGSTFWCTARFLKQPRSPRAIVPAGDLKGRRVLIVDDNESNRMILHTLVTGWGMADDVAEDAAAAWRLIEQSAHAGRPYELAILDVLMPEKDGLQLARELQRHPACAGLRIVVMTSLLQRGHAEQARQAGAMGYLPKPVRHDELRECLRTVLGMTTTPPSAPAPATPRLITRHTLAEDVRRPVVLIVEDNIVNQKLAVRMVEKLGYRSDVVGNGREALAALERGEYAAILMDCQMPVMDGFEATRIIREKEQRQWSIVNGHSKETGDKKSSSAPLTGRHIPIIAVTANAMQGDRERCLAAGMDEYLAKPVKLDELRLAMRGWVAAPPPDRPAIAADAGAPPGAERSVFDPAKMLQNIGSDRELFIQLVVLFLDRHDAMLNDIKSALAAGDALSLERAAHTLKGTAGNLCASAVAQAAARLEAVGRLAALHDAPAVYTQVEVEVVRLVGLLERYRQGDQPMAQAAA
jgi:signal transduction histidine kinase/CheY-like chemotaxis protein/PAS domain-containing protein